MIVALSPCYVPTGKNTEYLFIILSDYKHDFLSEDFVKYNHPFAIFDRKNKTVG